MQSENPSPDQAGNLGTQGGSPPSPSAGAPQAAFDPAALPGAALRILRDPAGSLTALHKPGKPALFQGLALGLAAAVFIPLVHFLVLKIRFGSDFPAEPGDLFLAMLGGAVFLAAGAAVSLGLRLKTSSGRSPDGQDDVYLVGSSMVILLAAVIVAGIFTSMGKEFTLAIAKASVILGVFLAATCYLHGLASLIGAKPGAVIWRAAIVFGVAIVIGGLLEFDVFGAGVAGNPQAAIMKGMKNSLEDAFKGIQFPMPR